jgi:hypothetical protein
MCSAWHSSDAKVQPHLSLNVLDVLVRFFFFFFFFLETICLHLGSILDFVVDGTTKPAQELELERTLVHGSNGSMVETIISENWGDRNDNGQTWTDLEKR